MELTRLSQKVDVLEQRTGVIEKDPEGSWAAKRARLDEDLSDVEAAFRALEERVRSARG